MSATDQPPVSLHETGGARSDAARPLVGTAPAATPQSRAVARAVAGAHGRRDLGGTARHLLATAFAVAWLACPLIEPVPTGHEAAYPLWQLPIDLAAVGTIVVAVGALWRGSRHAPRLGIAAGVLMAVETIVCPYAGHTPFGWWTWVQAGLSLYVLLTSAALQARRLS